MKKAFNCKVFGMGIVTGFFLLNGCVGAGVNTGVEIGTTNVNNFGSGPTGQKVAAEKPKPVAETQKIILLNDRKDMLRLMLKPEGTAPDEKGLAQNIAQQTAGALSGDDARIVTEGICDIRLVIRPKLTQVDRDGDYYRLNCSVVVEMKSAASNRIFGSKTIKIVSPRRVLGKEAAVSKFEEPAAKAVSDWCRKELQRLANSEIGSTVLTMQLRTVKNKKRDLKRDAAVIREISEQLGKLPNLVTYELVGQDNEKGTCQYRIVYFISAYPGGIANAVSALVGTIAQH